MILEDVRFLVYGALRSNLIYFQFEDSPTAMSKTFCIVGGGGYLGYDIAKDLRSCGHDVILFDRAKPADVWKSLQDESTLTGFKFVEGDVRNRGQLEEVFDGVDCVIHTASFGMSGREQLSIFWDTTEEVNISGVKCVIEACCSKNVASLVYTSTVNVVFGGQEIKNGTEDLPYFPLHKHEDHYSRTKSIAEQMVILANGRKLKSGDGVLATCALRLVGLMGPGEFRHLPRIMGYVKRGLVCFKYGMEDATVDFVSIQNATQAHSLAAAALLDGEKRNVVAGQAYFISDGKPIHNFDYIFKIVKELGYPVPQRRIPLLLVWILASLLELMPSYFWLKTGLTTFLTKTEIYKTAVTHYFSIEKAKTDLGYCPTKPNDTQEIVVWLRSLGFDKKDNLCDCSKFMFSAVLVVFVIVFAFILAKVFGGY